MEDRLIPCPSRKSEFRIDLDPVDHTWFPISASEVFHQAICSADGKEVYESVSNRSRPMA